MVIKMRLGKTNLEVNKNGFGALPIQRRNEKDSIEILKTAYDNIDTLDWIISGQHKFKVSTSKGRESIDIEKLKTNLLEFMSAEEAQNGRRGHGRRYRHRPPVSGPGMGYCAVQCDRCF